MEYIKADEGHLKRIFDIVQETVRTIYPRYYPKEVVDFFCRLHSVENIRRDIENQAVGILTEGDAVVGTGCFYDEHITRVYVLPEFQGRGYGTYIMDCLETEIAKKHEKVSLDSSLPASRFYERRSYFTVKHCMQEVENGVILVYEIMEKVCKNGKSQSDERRLC